MSFWYTRRILRIILDGLFDVNCGWGIMQYSQTKQGRIFVIRLTDGEIIHKEIEEFASSTKISVAQKWWNVVVSLFKPLCMHETFFRGIHTLVGVGAEGVALGLNEVLGKSASGKGVKII